MTPRSQKSCFVRWGVAVFLFGILIGLAFPNTWGTPQVSASPTFVQLGVHPGATSTMTCGWHSACTGSVPPFGAAIDWRNFGNDLVYWRSFGYRSDGINSPLGEGWITNQVGTCAVVQVAVSDAFGFPKGSILYTHSTSSWAPAPFDIAAHGTGWGNYHHGAVGRTLVTESSSCINAGLWDAAHLHQTHSGASWSQNTPAYCTPTSQNNKCYEYSYPNYQSGGNHQSAQQWWWS